VRQVSFTLLMTDHCDSNAAQYERNGSFGHLVHALGRPAGGATLPSTGLGLNASKAVSRLGKLGGDTFCEFRESKGSHHTVNNVIFYQMAVVRDCYRRSPASWEDCCASG
jgi:hypothetical protein